MLSITKNINLNNLKQKKFKKCIELSKSPTQVFEQSSLTIISGGGRCTVGSCNCSSYAGTRSGGNFCLRCNHRYESHNY